jgi:hypothetical protein
LGNPGIFELDYESLKDRIWKYGFGEELMQNRFNPKNIHKFHDWGFNDLVFEEDI